MPDLREKFLKIYANIPLSLKRGLCGGFQLHGKRKRDTEKIDEMEII